MKLLAFALDFDGTIARNDVLEASVREAIVTARARGIMVLLVTGRTVSDLRRVAGDLHFVDAVVGENGAVLEFPENGYSRVLGEPPPAVLLDELRREGIAYAAGRCILDAGANDATRILRILQRLELPLVLAFNRGVVMVMPQTIGKSTGLRPSLEILRLSPHNAVGIGDAENDFELLMACEVGVAVEWGSAALKRAADVVLPGSGPTAVAEYIRGLVDHPQIPTSGENRRTLLLGYSGDGRPVNLVVRGRNVLIAGDPKSGKSWVAGLLCEQLILLGYSLVVIDPEGDYTSLEALPRVSLYGGASPLPSPRELQRALRHPGASIVIDLSHIPHKEKLERVRNMLPALATLRSRTGLPHRIVVDEAHYFLQDPEIQALLDLSENGYTLVTYRPSKLSPQLLNATAAIIVTCESDPDEVRALHDLCLSCGGGMSQGEWTRILGSLVLGEALALPLATEAEKSLRQFHLAPRVTVHARHAGKYIDLPVPEWNAFVFWRNNAPDGRARTVQEFIEIAEHRPLTELDGHLRRGDFSAWFGKVFGDYPLAVQVRTLEDGYRENRNPETVPSILQAIRSRYQFLEP